MTREQIPLDGEDSEIRLEDILSAFRASWRGMLGGLLIAPALVAGGYAISGQYKAEAILSNSCPQSGCALGFMQWRGMSENLPALAGQWAQTLSRNGGQPGFMRTLAQAPWWEKNVVPVFALSQSETKKFPLMDEALKAETTHISQIRVTVSARGKAAAEEALSTTLQFFRDGAAFLEFKGLIEGYQTEVATHSARLESDRLQAELDASYVRSRLQHTETIEARDSQNASHDEVRVDVGTVASNFLPLRTQINALRISLYDLDEKLRRLKDQKVSMETLSAYLNEASPRVGSAYAGQTARELTKALMAVREGMAQSFPKEDGIHQAVFERIRGDLLAIEGRYGVRLPELVRRVDRVTPAPSLLTGAAFGGAFLGFLMAFGWSKLKDHRSLAKRI